MIINGIIYIYLYILVIKICWCHFCSIVLYAPERASSIESQHVTCHFLQMTKNLMNSIESEFKTLSLHHPNALTDIEVENSIEFDGNSSGAGVLLRSPNCASKAHRFLMDAPNGNIITPFAKPITGNTQCSSNVNVIVVFLGCTSNTLCFFLQSPR